MEILSNRKRPKKLYADKAYDAAEKPQVLRKRGIIFVSVTKNIVIFAVVIKI